MIYESKEMKLYNYKVKYNNRNIPTSYIIAARDKESIETYLKIQSISSYIITELKNDNRKPVFMVTVNGEIRELFTNENLLNEHIEYIKYYDGFKWIIAKTNKPYNYKTCLYVNDEIFLKDTLIY